MRKPTRAQAKLLAKVWATDFNPAVTVNGWNDPTLVCCVKYGWLIPTMEIGTHPSGMTYVRHAIGPDGRRALLAALQSLLR